MEVDGMNTILIRYGELFLKGNNKAFFESALTRNVRAALEGISCKFVKSRMRYYIEEFQEEDGAEILSRLTKVFGIHSVSPAKKLKTDLDEIKKAAAAMSPDAGKFRVTVKRSDPHVLQSSMQLASEIGAYMLQNAPNLKVDLFAYDFEMNVDIRENGYSYLFYGRILGAGGLPYGTGGKGMLLLSGGIDSPVAAYLMAKRGVKIHAVHFNSPPYTNELALQKVFDLAKALGPYAPEIEVSVVPFTEIQYAIHENCPASYMITIMRRIMMRIAERLAKEKKCGALITGESLGQVASQTMESIIVTNETVSLPVYRPLIGYDKDEIIAISKKIDAFDISIRPHQDCCTVFLPKNPVIRPSCADARKYEESLALEELIQNAIANIKIAVTPRPY